jgi:hypothetical protein
MDVHDKRLTAIEKKIDAVNVNDAEEPNKYKNKKFVKCDTCESVFEWCTHCNKCGESGHKRKDCTKN